MIMIPIAALASGIISLVHKGHSKLWGFFIALLSLAFGLFLYNNITLFKNWNNILIISGGCIAVLDTLYLFLVVRNDRRIHKKGNAKKAGRRNVNSAPNTPIQKTNCEAFDLSYTSAAELHIKRKPVVCEIQYVAEENTLDAIPDVFVSHNAGMLTIAPGNWPLGEVRYPQVMEEHANVLEAMPISQMDDSTPNQFAESSLCSELEAVVDAEASDISADPFHPADKRDPVLDVQDQMINDSPTTNIEEFSPTTNIEEDSPTTNIEEDSPTTNIEEDSPTTKIEEVSPATNIEEDSPTTKIEEDSPATKNDEESTVKSKNVSYDMPFQSYMQEITRLVSEKQYSRARAGIFEVLGMNLDLSADDKMRLMLIMKLLKDKEKGADGIQTR